MQFSTVAYGILSMSKSLIFLCFVDFPVRQVLWDDGLSVLINSRLKIGVTDIRPYDFVIADSDGVVIVPKELAYEVLIEAEAFMEK